LKYPKEAIEQNITGNVIIEFTVNKKGVLSNFKLSPTSPQKNIHLVNESIRVLKLSSGKWTPAKKDKKSIVANFSKSIMFAIVED
jgi:outer membrane biosynthesis protein TonB